MKNNNKKIIIIIGIILLLVAFFIYKFIMLKKYENEHLEIDKNLIFNKTLSIEYEQNNEDLVVFDEMSYGNYFSDYNQEEGLEIKVKYDDNGEVSSYYRISKESQYINTLNVNSFKLATEENNQNLDYTTEKTMKAFLNKNEINDDVDLIKYIKDNYYLKSNILTSTKTMRKNYILNSFAQMNTFESITLITGQNKGYILNVELKKFAIKEIHLLHNDNQYIITLGGTEIANDEFINSFLKTIKFN